MTKIGGFIGLAVLLIVLTALMRREIRLTRDEVRAAMRGACTALRVSQDQPHTEPKDEVAELREGQAELRERMAKLEGLLDGLREAVTWRAGPDLARRPPRRRLTEPTALRTTSASFGRQP